MGVVNMDFNQVCQNFKTAMIDQGITPPKDIISDGKLNRFHVHGDKPGSKNGFYALFMNNTPCGVFGSWKRGTKHKWCAKIRQHMSSHDFNEHQRQIKETKRQQAETRAKEQEEAAKQAEIFYDKLPWANHSHQYLTNKCIKPHYARQKGSNLILPIINVNGKFKSLQTITPDGNKRFWPNGSINSHFIPIQHQPSNDKTILICEGFATGASLAQRDPTVCVIAACNAGNLKAVAVNIRDHLPNSKIIIAADIDPVGLLKAREAAKAINANIIKPEFPEGISKKFNDFNDLHCWLNSIEVPT